MSSNLMPSGNRFPPRHEVISRSPTKAEACDCRSIVPAHAHAALDQCCLPTGIAPNMCLISGAQRDKSRLA